MQQRTAVTQAVIYWLLDSLTLVAKHPYLPSPEITDTALFTVMDGIGFSALGLETQGLRM